MKELLERWAELAPGECKYYPDDDVCHRDPEPRWRLDWGKGNDDWDYVYLEANEAAILYAVLMCCEARGWEVGMDNGNTPADMGGEWCVVFESSQRETDIDAFADSPAEAALTAYIKALEANA